LISGEFYFILLLLYLLNKIETKEMNEATCNFYYIYICAGMRGLNKVIKYELGKKNGSWQVILINITCHGAFEKNLL